MKGVLPPFLKPTAKALNSVLSPQQIILTPLPKYKNNSSNVNYLFYRTIYLFFFKFAYPIHIIITYISECTFYSFVSIIPLLAHSFKCTQKTCSPEHINVAYLSRKIEQTDGEIGEIKQEITFDTWRVAYSPYIGFGLMKCIKNRVRILFTGFSQGNMNE